MSDIQYLVERYIAAWNTTDPAARRALIGEVSAADARYTDPLADVRKGRPPLGAPLTRILGGRWAAFTARRGGRG